MPLLDKVGKPILPGNCQDENQKRKFMVRRWHRIAASLVSNPATTCAVFVTFGAMEESRGISRYDKRLCTLNSIY
jgi:hypothetical protein